MVYNAASKWADYLVGSALALPAQGLIRVMRGSYPRLSGVPQSGAALDVGCGEGRNVRFLEGLGFSAVGLEISQELVADLRSRSSGRADFVVGHSGEIPFPDQSFDLLVGWNSVYYMGSGSVRLSDHLQEFRRVLKNEGTAVFSIPQPTSFIYSQFENVSLDTKLEGVDYGVVMSDPFGLRVGETLARFSDLNALKSAMFSSFGGVEISVGEEKGDWFGLQYDWWVVVVSAIASKR